MALPDRLLEGIHTLDPLPVTTQRLMEVLDEEDTPFGEIVGIVEHDAAVAANVLRIANSSMLASRFPITEMRAAVIRLGLDMLLQIVIGDYMRGIVRDAPMYDLSEHDLWLHSAVSGIAVRQISEICGPERVPGRAGIAALVHDIGKLVIVRELEADVRRIQRVCEERQAPFVEIERELFGCDHAEVGAALAREWKFPDEVTLAIALHHEPRVEQPSPVLDAVVLANLVAKSAGAGLGAEGLNLQIPEGTHERLGVDEAAMARICARTIGLMLELEHFQE